jgi:hypothetical protein
VDPVQVSNLNARITSITRWFEVLIFIFVLFVAFAFACISDSTSRTSFLESVIAQHGLVEISSDRSSRENAAFLARRKIPFAILGTEPDPFSGIISHLSRKYGGNVHDLQKVVITSSSADPDFPVRHVADLNSDTCFRAGYGPVHGQWVTWDFGTIRILPTHYSIGFQPYYGFPWSWVIEVSVNHVTWVEIHLSEYHGRPDENYIVSKRLECRFLRLRAIDKFRMYRGSLSLCNFEVFGYLVE